MSLVFINANGHTNNVNYAGYGQPYLCDHNAFTVIADDTDTGIKDLMADVNSHTFDSVMGVNPYLRAHYDESNIFVSLVNGTGTKITFSVLGVAYQADIADGQATFPIKVHPACSAQKLTVSIRVDGFPFTSVEIGGNGSAVEAQIYQDSTGMYNVVPVKSADLANYWTASSMDTSWMIADLATITGLNAYVLFNYVLPALNLTLTADEQTALTDIQSNVVPNIVTTLASAGQGNDIHYLSYKEHISQAKTAMDNYTNDRNEIMKYITLK